MRISLIYWQDAVDDEEDDSDNNDDVDDGGEEQVVNNEDTEGDETGTGQHLPPVGAH